MAQMNTVSSRAIAGATLGFAFPRATSFRKRDVRRSWAFHAMSQTVFGNASCRYSICRPMRGTPWYAHAASASKRRACGLPALVIPPRRTLGPLEYSEGTRPRYAISSRGCVNRRMSPISVTRPTAVTHETPRLPRLHDRGPAPRRRELPELVGEPLDPAFGVVDRVAVLLQRDVLRGERETEIGQPATIRARPSGASR